MDPTGGTEIVGFFFPNPPANPKTWRIFGNDDLICGTFGIWFYAFKRCLTNPTKPTGWLVVQQL